MVPIYFHNNNIWDIIPANTVSLLFRSLWFSPKGDLNNEVPMFCVFVDVIISCIISLMHNSIEQADIWIIILLSVSFNLPTVLWENMFQSGNFVLATNFRSVCMNKKLTHKG